MPLVWVLIYCDFCPYYMGAGGGSGPRRKEGNAKRWRKKMANSKPKLQATYKERDLE